MRIRNNIVAQYFPETDRHYKAPDDLILSIVKDCLDPEEIAQMDFGTSMQRIASRRCGRLQQKKAHAIWEEAKDSVGCDVTASVQWEAQSLVAQLKGVRDRIFQLSLFGTFEIFYGFERKMVNIFVLLIFNIMQQLSSARRASVSNYWFYP